MRDAADDLLTRVFPIVVEAAADGDLQAREILSYAAEFLAELSGFVIERLKLRLERFRIVKAGGAMGRSEFFDVPLDQALRKLAPLAIIESLNAAPVEAAARLAQRLITASGSPGN
jgi:N-acetylglucosamine kinase-like BadF-type ATPase